MNSSLDFSLGGKISVNLLMHCYDFRSENEQFLMVYLISKSGIQWIRTQFSFQQFHNFV